MALQNAEASCPSIWQDTLRTALICLSASIAVPVSCLEKTAQDESDESSPRILNRIGASFPRHA
jgi:hypothetical protein